MASLLCRLRPFLLQGLPKEGHLGGGLAVRSRLFSHREERKDRKSEAKLKNREVRLPKKVLADFANKAQLDGINYEQLFSSITRPMTTKLFSFASEVPQVLDSKNLRSNVTPLLAEQSLSDVLELNPEDLDIEAFNRAIHSNGILKRAGEAEKAFRIMEQKQIKPDETTFACLMNAYANVGDLKQTLSTFESISKAGLVPNVWHYSVLTKAFVSGGHLDSAFKLFAQMKQESVYIGQPIYAMLIAGCTRSGLYDRAWEVYDSMIREDKEIPDEVTYSSLIYVCAKTQKVEKALQLLDEMYKHNLRPTDVTFNTLIYACSSRVDTYLQGFDIVNQMRTHGFVPDLITFSSLLRGCSKAGDLANAFAVWSEMAIRDIKPNELCFTSMMWTLANKKGFEERKEKLRKRMDKFREVDHNPNLGAQSSAAGGRTYELFNDDMDQDIIEEANKIAQEAEQDFTSAISKQREEELRFAEQKDQVRLARSLFAEARKQGIALDPVFLRAYLAVFANNRRFKEAEQVFKEVLPESGLEPGVPDYRIMLQLCWAEGDFRTAQGYWFRMREQGLSPDAASFMYYVHTASRAGKYEHVLMLMREMAERGMVPDRVELLILRRELFESDAAWVWKQIEALGMVREGLPRFKNRRPSLLLSS